MPQIFNKIASYGPTLKKAVIPSLAAGGLLAGGSAVGFKSYKNRENEESGDRIGHSLGLGIATASYAAVPVVGGLGLLGATDFAAKAFGKPTMGNLVGQLVASKANSPLRLPAVFNNTTPITKAGLKSFASKASVMGGVGAVVGGAIGYNLDSDNPKTTAAAGAAIGGVGGIAASTAIKGMKTWKNIGSLGRGGAIIGLTAALAVGSRAIMKQPQYQAEDISQSDGAGDYSNTSSSGVKQRLNTMNANGDIVFGLNRKR